MTQFSENVSVIVKKSVSTAAMATDRLNVPLDDQDKLKILLRQLAARTQKK